METLRLRMDLRFEQGIVFEAFVPNKKNQCSFRLGDGRYLGFLSVTKPDSQMHENYNATAVYGGASVDCKGLTLELEDLHPDVRIVELIERGKVNEQMAQFGREIYMIGINVQNRVIDFCRNKKRQIHLEPIREDSTLFDHYLIAWNLRWLHRTGEWRLFYTTSKLASYSAYVRAYYRNGLREQDWKELAVFLEGNRSVAMRDVLMVNSYKHISSNNARIAIVEAVIALEAGIRSLLPRVILSRLGSREVSEGLVNSLIEKAGLRTTTEVVLSILLPEERLAKSALEAIELRNEIVHRGRRGVKREVAERLVKDIDQILKHFLGEL